MSSTDINERVLQNKKLSVVRNLFNSATYGEPGTKINYDRFIPSRVNNNWQTSFASIPEPARNSSSGKKPRDTSDSPRDSLTYTCLLRNEVLGDNIEDIKTQCDERQALTPLKNRNLFQYGTPRVSL